MNKTFIQSDNRLLSFWLTFAGNTAQREYVCLDNASHGLFITPKDMMCWHRWQENPRVDPITEARISIKRFEYSFETGYYYDIIKGSLKANNEYEIQNPESGKGLKNNWSGIRLTMGVGYFIKLQ